MKHATMQSTHLSFSKVAAAWDGLAEQRLLHGSCFRCLHDSIYILFDVIVSCLWLRHAWLLLLELGVLRLQPRTLALREHVSRKPRLS